MKIEHILCPTDFSKTSDAAIEKATALARRHDATLHLIHVYEPVFADGYMEGMPTEPKPADLEAVRTHLEDLQPPGDNAVKCRHELVFGFPGGSIVGYAKTNKVDLIVMGTHGRSGPSRLLMGSVAEAVMRAARCPVLVVHEKVPSC